MEFPLFNEREILVIVRKIPDSSLVRGQGSKAERAREGEGGIIELGIYIWIEVAGPIGRRSHWNPGYLIGGVEGRAFQSARGHLNPNVLRPAALVGMKAGDFPSTDDLVGHPAVVQEFSTPPHRQIVTVGN